MFKNLILALTLLFWYSIAWSNEYVLVMSKDDHVCQHILKIYNEDLKENGEIKYDQHAEFEAIKWKEKAYVWQVDDYQSTGTLMASSFDINNDGKKEFVLKVGDLRLKGKPSDNVFIFDEKDVDTSKNEILFTKELKTKIITILGGALGQAVQFKGNVYNLNELPAFETFRLEQKEIPFKYALGGWFYFQPFLYAGKYFVSMNDWHPNMEMKWQVILQYSKENHLRDICYLLQACPDQNDK